jgi:energy-coupling factor transport system ATP-binding protein
VLSGLDLTIGAGERVVLLGPSGAGKSTLLRALAGLLQTADHGDLSGTALVDGRPVGERPGEIALLLQDPAAALVAETVGRDVAFGPENLRLPRDEIWRRVRRALDETSFPYDVDRLTRSLSGGESQRLALAGSLAVRSRALLLDEPTSMLDETTAAAVRMAVQSAVRDRGTTLVVVEHRFGPWLGFADRLIVLDKDGGVVADGDPGSVLTVHADALVAAGVWVPDRPPPTVQPLDPALVEPWCPVSGTVVRATGISLTLTSRVPGRERLRTLALDDVAASLSAACLLAVTGESGAGKSTLLTVLAGLQRPSAGGVVAHEALATSRGRTPWRWRSRDLAARLAWSPQLPEVGVVASTVRDEVAASGRAVGREAGWLDRRTDGLLDAFGLAGLAQASPYHLSGGEQRRLMIAAALAHGPTAGLFDEPTVGQDRLTWAAVVAALTGARAAGAAIGVATHDLPVIDDLADSLLPLSPPARETT